MATLFCLNTHTHPALLKALSEHDNGFGPRLPNHPPEVCDGTRQRTLSCYKLIRTQIALRNRDKTQNKTGA